MRNKTRKKIINILKYGKEWEINKYYLKNRRAGLCIWIGNGTYGFQQDSFEAEIMDDFKNLMPSFSLFDKIILRKHIIICIKKLTGKNPKKFLLYN